MQEADYQAVQALSRSLGRNAEPARFGVEGCQLVLKDSQDKLLGRAKASWWDPDDELAPAGFYLSGVEIAADFQQHGLASILTTARLEWIAHRADRAWCVVNAQNTASLALQRSFGFREICRAPQFGSVQFTGGSGLLLCKEVTPSNRVSADRKK